MTQETKNDVLACFNAWKEEKGQKALCSEQMKVQVDESALKICDNPGDREELKRNKKRITKLFQYLESEDKESDDPFAVAALIEEFTK